MSGGREKWVVVCKRHVGGRWGMDNKKLFELFILDTS